MSNKLDRAELGADGDCVFALLGVDLQVGEAEFEEIIAPDDGTKAAQKALERLRTRVGRPNLEGYWPRLGENDSR